MRGKKKKGTREQTSPLISRSFSSKLVQNIFNDKTTRTENIVLKSCYFCCCCCRRCFDYICACAYIAT